MPVPASREAWVEAATRVQPWLWMVATASPSTIIPSVTYPHPPSASLTLNSPPAELGVLLSQQLQLTLVIDRDGSIDAASSPSVTAPADGLHVLLGRRFADLWEGDDAHEASTALLRCCERGTALDIAWLSHESPVRRIGVLSPLLSAGGPPRMLPTNLTQVR